MNVLGQGVEDGTNDVDCNEDEKCMKEVAMARLIYKMSFGGGNRMQLFGSFLKSFAPILLDQFDSNEVMSVVCILFQCQTDLCSKFDTAEKHLHDYFFSTVAWFWNLQPCNSAKPGNCHHILLIFAIFSCRLQSFINCIFHG